MFTSRFGLSLYSDSGYTVFFRVKEGVGNVFLWLRQVAYLTVTLYTACQNFIQKAS